jgi:transposase-like protein/IS1 family transposase
MLCPTCQTDARKFGRDRSGNQRFQCLACRKTFSDRPANPLGDMRLSLDKAVQVLQLLLEGMSVRATMRVTGVNRNTILALVAVVGDNCERMLEARLIGVPVRDVQVDEVWGYVFCKEKTKERTRPGQEEIGDAYCYMGIERTTKLILAWHLGRRCVDDTHEFARKLATATSGHFQITTDGFRPYRAIIPATFPGQDFATLVKTYATKGDEHRYSPGEVNGTIKTPCCGNPDPAKICTSHVERGNLTVRMQDRRMTRLTNAFSKKWDNHRASMALHFAWFNYGRPHMTLTEATRGEDKSQRAVPTTPAMAAGLEERPWTLRELVERSTH